MISKEVRNVGRPVRIHAAPAAASSRLNELGVSQDILRQALEYGLQYAFSVTLHDPTGEEGSLMWIKTVRGLRDGLVPQGWKPDSAKNYQTTIHPSGTHAIAVAGGNANTGIGDKHPTTKRDRGQATRDAVDANSQLDMADLEETFPRSLRPLTVPRLHTWLLLHYIDRTAQEVRSELSLPLEMTDDGFVSSWQERVILSSVPFSPDAVPTDDTDEPDIDIDIKRKAN